MSEYVLFFKNGGSVVLSEEENADVIEHFKKSPEVDVHLFADNTFLLLSQLSHSYKEEPIETVSQVITPPSPTELRKNEELTEQNKDVTLDAQLAGTV